MGNLIMFNHILISLVIFVMSALGFFIGQAVGHGQGIREAQSKHRLAKLAECRAKDRD